MVPLADRIRYLQAFRVALVAVVAGAWLLVPAVGTAPALDVLAPLAPYLLLAALAWGARGRPALALFGAMLLTDGVLLVWLVYRTGGALQPLVLAHVVVVTLVASFPTGVKVTVWHSLLALGAFHAGEAGLLTSRDAGLADVGLEITLLWVAALATATYAAVNERELRRGRDDLERLAELAHQLERATAPEEAADALTDVAGDLGFGRVLVADIRGREPVLLAARGVAAGGPEAPDGAASVLRAAPERDAPLLVTHLDPRHDAWLTARLPGARNLIVVPLLADGRAVAILVAEAGDGHGPRLARRLVAVLERCAAQTALALRTTWLLASLQRMADTDGLTGVANRRAFDAALARELAQAERSGSPVGLLMLDIDRFKALNDAHGHQVGDAVLQAVARTLEEQSRAGDVVARYGGEEFTVILPGLDPPATMEAAERLRSAVAVASGPVPITASFGVAAFPEHGDDPDALIAAADAGVYAAKAAGRDCVLPAPARVHGRP